MYFQDSSVHPHAVWNFCYMCPFKTSPSSISCSFYMQILAIPLVNPHFEQMTLHFSSSGNPAAIRWKCPPFPTLSYICAQIYMHAFHSFSFTMDELFLSIQYIFKGGIILVSGHLQLCLFLLTCQLLSHFIQILAFLIKKENNLLIPCLCSIP